MKYTVVLRRPDYISSEDIYVAHVEADGYSKAIAQARHEVCECDSGDGMHTREDDYGLIVMFKGHLKVELFGWQL